MYSDKLQVAKLLAASSPTAKGVTLDLFCLFYYM